MRYRICWKVYAFNGYNNRGCPIWIPSDSCEHFYATQQEAEGAIEKLKKEGNVTAKSATIEEIK